MFLWVVVEVPRFKSTFTMEASIAECFTAIKDCYVQKLNRLLDEGVDVDAKRSGGDQNTLLISGAYCGHGSIVRLLLYTGANAAVTIYDGWTALVYAEMKKHPSCVALLGLIADCWSALMIAAQFGYVECISLLFVSGVNLSLRDDDGRTAKDYAIVQGIVETWNRAFEPPALEKARNTFTKLLLG